MSNMKAWTAIQPTSSALQPITDKTKSGMKKRHPPAFFCRAHCRERWCGAQTRPPGQRPARGVLGLPAPCRVYGHFTFETNPGEQSHSLLITNDLMQVESRGSFSTWSKYSINSTTFGTIPASSFSSTSIALFGK
jgi:hypothetical protein